MDAKTRSGILDHTKASFPLDTYANVTDDIQRQAAQVMDTFMTEIFGKGLIPWQSGESPAAAIRSATTSGKGGIHPEGRTASRAPGMSAPYPGRVRGEAESSDCRHESEKETPADAGVFLSVVFL